MHFSAAAALLCALSAESVFAHPSANLHPHLHRHASAHTLAKRRWQDVDFTKLDYSNIPGANGTPAPGAASAAPEPFVPPPETKPGSNGLQYKDHFGGRSMAVSNGNVDQYIGNHGSPHGSNVIAIAPETVDKYSYTITVHNVLSEEMEIAVWNKNGPDGRPNSGHFLAPVLTFKLAPGTHEVIAFDDNTQGALCRDRGRKGPFGQRQCTWVEYDFKNESNGGHCGWDVSTIQAFNGGVDDLVTVTSSVGRTSSNFYNGYSIAEEHIGGIGGHAASGPVHLQAIMGRACKA